MNRKWADSSDAELFGLGLVIGVALGVAIGAVLGQVGVGIAIGAGLGVAIAEWLKLVRNRARASEHSPDDPADPDGRA